MRIPQLNSLPGPSFVRLRTRYFGPVVTLLLWGAFLIGTASPAQQLTAAPDNAPAPLPSGAIKGDVVDVSGNAIPGATVALTWNGAGTPAVTTADEQGHYAFTHLPAGSFELNVSAAGFGTQTLSGKLLHGQWLSLPDIALPVGIATQEVHVSMTQYELAEEQIQVEEKQRVLGFIPNFYVAYKHDTLPLTPRQKFELAWKTSIDPVTLAATAITAGVEQGTDTYEGFGQGVSGYAKRFGAAYGDGTINNYLGGAVLPSLLKQDPRYFYKGTGTIRQRALYAIAMSVVCRGDSGHWQFNFSGVMGGIGAAGISDLYYPAANRSSAGLIFENTGIGIGTSAIGNLFQEFLVKKLTPHSRKVDPDQP